MRMLLNRDVNKKYGKLNFIIVKNQERKQTERSASEI